MFKINALQNWKPFSILLLVSILALGSCDYDNYDPPEAMLSGQLTYGGNNLQFDGYAEGTGLSKIIELYQSGFGKSGVPISATVNADGSFKQLLFPGKYAITLRNTPYPFTFDNWEKTATGAFDSLHVELSGAYQLPIPVKPYFDISDVQTAIDGTNITVTFNVKRIQEGANLLKARLFVNTASIVNSATPASAEAAITDLSQPVSISFSIPNYRTRYTNNFRDYAFVRVALETDRSPTYLLWSPVYKVENVPLEFNSVNLLQVD